MFDLKRFVDKYLLARETALEYKPIGGFVRLRAGMDLLDHQFRPLSTVGGDTGLQSFVDYLRTQCLSPWLREFQPARSVQLDDRMGDRPYYQVHAAVYEARLMEAVLINALGKAGGQVGEEMYYWHGNLPVLTPVITPPSPARGTLPNAATWSAAWIYTGTTWRRRARTPTFRCPTRCSPGTSCTLPHRAR